VCTLSEIVSFHHSMLWGFRFSGSYIKRGISSIILCDGRLAVYSLWTSSSTCAVHMPLRNQIEKGWPWRTSTPSRCHCNEPFFCVLTACYELTLVFSRSFYSIILEIGQTKIASWVSRPKADTIEIVINEQTITNAHQTMTGEMIQQIVVGS